MLNFCVLNVGKGNAAVLRDGEATIVIDAGANRSLLSYLEAERINRVSALILSHADADHIGGAIELVLADSVIVERVFLNSDSSKDTAAWEDLVTLVCELNRTKKIQFEHRLSTNQSGKIHKGNVEVEILAPSPYLATKAVGGKDRHGRKITSNSMSVVIRLTLQGSSVALLTGDLDQIGLESIIDEKHNLQSPLVVFPHHGGKPGNGEIDSFCQQICQMALPQYIVFSVGVNDARFPAAEVLEAIIRHHPGAVLVSTEATEPFAQHLARNKTRQDVNGSGHVYLSTGKKGIFVKYERPNG